MKMLLDLNVTSVTDVAAVLRRAANDYRDSYLHDPSAIWLHIADQLDIAADRCISVVKQQATLAA